MKNKKIVDKQEIARQKRNEKLAKGIHDAVKFFDLEVTFRNFVLENFYKAYVPSDEDIKRRIHLKVEEVIQSNDALSTALEGTIEKVIRERITELGEEYQNKIKEQLIEAIKEKLNYYE